MSRQELTLAFAWFQPEEWQKLKETVDDPDSLDDSYEDWRKEAERTIKMLRDNGQKIQKISIKVNDLVVWCNKKNINLDGKARSEYAAFLAQQRNK